MICQCLADQLLAEAEFFHPSITEFVFISKSLSNSLVVSVAAARAGVTQRSPGSENCA